MMKGGVTILRVKLFSMILLLIFLTGCHRTNQEINVFNYCPSNIIIYENEASYQRTIRVFYSKEVVEKMEITDKIIFDLEDEELIKRYDEVNRITYEGEAFQIEGFAQFSNIQDNIYTSTIILEYDQMDMKQLIEEDNWFIHAKDIVNDKLEVDYSKLEKMILDDGYEQVE